jgi:cellulose biosynthesis protein BcsS
VLVAPNGFDDDGLLFKLLISGGLYRYNSGYLGEEVVGAEWLGQALAGWRVKRHGLEMKFFFGSDWERHKLLPDDPGSRLRRRRSRLAHGGGILD